MPSYLSSAVSAPASDVTQSIARDQSSYIPGLDGIRAVAFLLVFGAHATPGRISTFIPATLGVTIFFFLSGYLITTLLRTEVGRTGTISLRDFYIRRTLRIFLPLYIAYTLAVLISALLHRPTGNTAGFFSMLFYYANYANVTQMHAYLPAGMSVIWSLAVEEHFYLLFPLLYLTFVRRRLSSSTQASILVTLCGLALVWRLVVLLYFHRTTGWTYFTTDCRFDSILWGSVLALRNNPRFNDPPLVPRRFAYPSFLAALALIGATLVVRSELFRDSLRYTLQALALYVIFAFIVSTIRHPAVRWLELPAVRYMGWISYSLYLFHHFILHILDDRFPGQIWLSGSIGFVLVLAYAVFMRYAVELPLQSLRSRFRHVPETEPALPLAA